MTRVASEQEYFRLRAEWLRFKNHVYDTNTELPTLSAVLDDARRLMEERGALGLLYLDVGGEGQIETLHGWEAYDDLLRAFAQTLIGLRGDGLLGPRDIVATLAVRSDKFLLLFGGPGSSTLDLPNLEQAAQRLRERIEQALPIRLPPLAAGLTPLAFQQGHALMHRDPMLRAERSVHRALDEAMYMSLRRRRRDEDRRAQGLDAVLEGQRVVTVFQPIFSLRELTVIGHEVFSRGPAGSSIEDPERLFGLAARTGRLVELERICRARALSSVRRHLAPGRKLFLNLSAGALLDPAIANGGLLQEVACQGLDRHDVVLEISERVAVGERQAYQRILKELKREGMGIAIDDMGAGYSSLQAMVELEPDYLKFDVSLVRNIDRSLIKRSLLETLVDLSQKIGARVIAEGIEGESEFATLRDMGVPLGQGRYLAPPLPVPQEGSPPA